MPLPSRSSPPAAPSRPGARRRRRGARRDGRRLRGWGTAVLFDAGARPLPRCRCGWRPRDLVTLPSQHEGTPNVLLEALACGRRVVATPGGRHSRRGLRPELGELVPVGSLRLWRRRSNACSTATTTLAVAALGARGGWDESAARLADVLAKATASGPMSRGLHGWSTSGLIWPSRTSEAWPNCRSWPRQPAARVEEPAHPRAGRRLAERRAGEPGQRRGPAGRADVRRRARRDDGRVPRRAGPVRRARDIFLSVGKECEPPRRPCCAIAARGHEVAGHGFTHDSFPTLTRGPARRAGAHRRRCCRRRRRGGRWCVRPAGRRRCGLWRCRRAGGLHKPCCGRATRTIVGRLARRSGGAPGPDGLSPGEIVLLHEAQDWTLAALPRALEALARGGLASA